MKRILIFLAFLTGLFAADIYVNGQKVGSDQNSTYRGESKNEILKQEGKKEKEKSDIKESSFASATLRLVLSCTSFATARTHSL